MHHLEFRKIFLFYIVSHVALVKSAKRQNCSDSDEAVEFQNQYLFDDTCTSVCVQTCGNDNPSSCLETVALDGTCGAYATCGATGCECNSFSDITAAVTSTNFATAVETLIECSATHVTFRFSKCPANAYGLYLDNMFMDGPGTSDGTTLITDAQNTCKGKVAYHSNSLLYDFTLTHFNVCNTVTEETSDKIIWSNAVIGLPTAPASPSNISRGRSMHLNFTCIFAHQLKTSLAGALSPVNGVYEGILASGHGAVAITIGLWSDNTYSTPFSSGARVDVLSRVYVGISSATFVAGQHFVIIASHVTPSPNRDDATRYDLIVDSCPVDSYTTITKTGVDNEILYNFAALLFASLPEIGQSIWVHATVQVCAPSATCPKVCPSRKRRSTSQDDGTTISVGPITITSKPGHPPSSVSENSKAKKKDFLQVESAIEQLIENRSKMFTLLPVCFGMVCLLAGCITIIGICMHCCYVSNVLSKIKKIRLFKKKQELVV